MTQRSSAFAKTLGLLVATLLIGALLGAAMVGHVVRTRLAQASDLATAEGFSRQILTLVDPQDPSQDAAIRPILDRHGEEVSAVIDGARADINRIIERLDGELEPLLTPEQLKRLRDRRALLRRRVDRLRQ